MDQIKKRRKTIRAQVTRICSECETLLRAKPFENQKLEVKLEMLTIQHQNLQEYDQQILDDLYNNDETEELIQKEVENQEGYMEKYLMMKKTIKEATKPPTNRICEDDTSSEAGSTVGIGKNYSLPKVKVREFSGQILDWLPYWSQFYSIHDDESIPKSVKFTLLLQSLEKAPDAHQLVSNYAATDTNYDEVIKVLTNRYGRDDIQIQEHVRRLLLLQDPRNRDKSFQKQWTISEAYIRNLKSLKMDGVDSETWLYLILEGTVPKDILLQWQLSPEAKKDGKNEDPPKTRLDYFRYFINQQLEARLSVDLATMSIQNDSESNKAGKSQQKKGPKKEEKFATAAGLYSGQTTSACVFCDGRHASTECGKARKMTLEERNGKLSDMRACLKCFKKGHHVKFCKAFAQCFYCSGYHHTLMCPNPNRCESSGGQENKVHVSDPKTSASSSIPSSTTANQSSIQCTNEVLMKTIMVKASCQDSNEIRIVRLLFDEGCQRSSVSKHLIRQLRSKPIGQEVSREVLGDGSVTNYQRVFQYSIRLTGIRNNFSMNVVLREKNKIGGGTPRIPFGPWLKTLQDKGVHLTDCINTSIDRNDIDICIGSDVEALIKTGEKTDLANGLAAWNTKLGWTLSGPIAQESYGTTTINMFCGKNEISHLWNLEILGISDPITKLSEQEEENVARETFFRTTTRNGDGRYSVNLPWKTSQSDLVNNFKIAEKRLVSTTTKLEVKIRYEEYDKIFNDWLDEGFIEEVLDDDKSSHYLPHHPVFKDSSTTTPVRPVFDASCKAYQSPSLNDCLYKGPNCIEMLPSILMRFREGSVGVIADIRKAFHMIEVKEEDRKFLKFLWWKEKGNRTKTYRHCRVVFGVNSSPFLLASVLKLHLSNEQFDQVLCKKILLSMYVDNLVTSVSSHQEAEDFRVNSIHILKDAQMDLRQWECTFGDDTEVGYFTRDWSELESGKEITKVLGMKWNKREDSLGLIIPPAEPFINTIMTKRSLLSFVSQIFDPIGVTSPATIVPKLIIQNAWKKKQDWDRELDEISIRQVNTWTKSVSMLSGIRIPRIHGFCNPSYQELHTFNDASKDAFACGVFLKTQLNDEVSVQLLAAKARVAPFQKGKRPTIPRLELMGCLIGARLTSAVKEALKFENIKSYFWTDSTTALAWIKRNGDWGTFVGNRVKSILQLTEQKQWRYVPGSMNPADLPSRGCTPGELLESRWWEGPSWIYHEENWPFPEQIEEDEVSINAERKRTQANMFSSDKIFHTVSYMKNVKTIAWWQRFVNFKCRRKLPESKYLSLQEIRLAEVGVIRIIQRDIDMKSLGKKLGLIQDKDGIIRVKTAIVNRNDQANFLFPFLLPGKHDFVRSMISQCHINYCHAGIQFLMKKLREKYWITQTRKSISHVIHRCVTCQRYDKKKATQDPAPLPKKRVTDGEVFTTTGVDLAGPLYLKSGKKVWIIIFTCAVYRCVVLDIVTTLETISFLKALERFICMFGRPDNLYSDNGTNLVGAANLFDELDWKAIEKGSQIKQIQWTFNPPTAAWWGGFWERMIRSVKDLLRRMLGRAKLSFDELRTIIQSVAATINERPLTTVTEDPQDLSPLTPAMFLRGTKGTHFPEGAEITGSMLRGQYEKMQVLREAINARFRKEYLALLVRKPITPKSQLKVGQLVLVGSDNKKRYEWPLGRVEKLIDGVDGKVRVVRVKTMGGIQIRPLQRLYPLELPEITSFVCNDAKKMTEKKPECGSGMKFSRYGRKLREPNRYTNWNK